MIGLFMVIILVFMFIYLSVLNEKTPKPLSANSNNISKCVSCHSSGCNLRE